MLDAVCRLSIFTSCLHQCSSIATLPRQPPSDSVIDCTVVLMSTFLLIPMTWQRCSCCKRYGPKHNEGCKGIERDQEGQEARLAFPLFACYICMLARLRDHREAGEVLQEYIQRHILREYDLAGCATRPLVRDARI